MEFASAKQSSTRTTGRGRDQIYRKAEYAINGYEDDFSATTLHKKTPAWWTGTLRENTFITCVQVYGRARIGDNEFIKGFRITIEDENGKVQYVSNRHHGDYEDPYEVKLEENVSLNHANSFNYVKIGDVKGVVGKKVTVQIQGQRALCIREIKVFGMLESEMNAQANATIENFNYTIPNDEETSENSSDEFDYSEDDSSKFSN